MELHVYRGQVHVHVSGVDPNHIANKGRPKRRLFACDQHTHGPIGRRPRRVQVINQGDTAVMDDRGMNGSRKPVTLNGLEFD